MIDLLIRGGVVITPAGVGNWDIGVKDGKIALIAQHGTLDQLSTRVVDASGKVVTPGGIEPHAHLAQFINMRTESEMYTLGPEQATVGMAFGGVTTHIDFCFIYPGTTLRKGIEQRLTRWKGQSLVDYSFHVAIMGGCPIPALEEVPDLVRDGFASFKVFTNNVLPPRPPRRTYKMDFGRLAMLMEKAAASGAILLVHAEDDDIVQFNYEWLAATGKTAGTNLHLVHSKLSERLAFARTIDLADATGAAVYFVHTSASDGVNAIARARAAGRPIYGETLHQYLCHTADDYKLQGGFRFHTYPSVKTAEDQASLWSALMHGELSTVATDEFPTSLAVKLAGSSIDDVTGGNLGAEARMGIVYSEGVNRRGMSLQRFAEVTSTNAARIFGLYPRKGVLAAGSDADIVLMDTNIRRKLTMEDFHVSDYSPWEGWEVTAWPSTTMLRGKVIASDGHLLGKPGDGEFLRRRIDPSVLQRPVC